MSNKKIQEKLSKKLVLVIRNERHLQSLMKDIRALQSSSASTYINSTKEDINLLIKRCERNSYEFTAAKLKECQEALTKKSTAEFLKLTEQAINAVSDDYNEQIIRLNLPLGFFKENIEGFRCDVQLEDLEVTSDEDKKIK